MNPDAYRSAEDQLWRHVGAAPRDRMVELARPRLKVRVQEVGDGPPTLFVHGGPNAGTTFAPLVGQLPGRRCILLDRPGCGLSEPPDYAAQDVRELAVDTLTSLLDALALPRVDIVASSMGGLWSIWFALAHPDRVGRMVQLGAPAGVPGMRTPPFMRLFATPGLSSLMTRTPADLPMMKKIMGWIGHGKSVAEGRFSDPYWRWSLALGEHTDTMTHDVRLIRRAVSPIVGMRAACRLSDEELGRLAAPLLWIWGSADTFGGVDVLERARRASPAAAWHLIPDGGHLPWLDDPETAARLTEAHLAGERADTLAS